MKFDNEDFKGKYERNPGYGDLNKMRILSKIIIICLFLFINLYPEDKEIQCTHLTAEDGLSLNIVTKILQDSRGFLWFGTFDGLNRYDGYNFKIFLPEPANPNSISGHSITAHLDAVLEIKIQPRNLIQN